DRLKALVAAGETDFFIFIRSAGANHAHDRDEPINVPHIAHAAEANHGGAFDMMDAARAAAGDHLPNFRIFPRLQPFQVNSDAPTGKVVFDIPHHGQAALGENIHFN